MSSGTRFQTRSGLGVRSSSVSCPPVRYRSCQRWNVARGMSIRPNVRRKADCSTSRMISSFSAAEYLIRRPPTDRNNRGSGQSLAAAKLDYTRLTPKALHDNPDPAFRRIVTPGRAANVLDDLFRRFLRRHGSRLIWPPRKATMSRKSSLPQPIHSVSRVPTANIADHIDRLSDDMRLVGVGS